MTDLFHDAGQDVRAPDLPGHGLDRGWLADQTMENYVERIIESVDAAPDQVTLVGHSMGGAIASAVADARPHNVARLIYLTAYIPTNGESVSDVVKIDPASHVKVDRVDVEGMNVVSLKSGTLADAFYNDATPKMLGFAEDRVQLQSPVPFRYKFEFNSPMLNDIPKMAIICTRDRAISPDHQRMMATRMNCDPVVEIDAGHSPFVTQPEKLAEIILG